MSTKVYGVEHSAPPTFGRAAITFGIGPHSSLLYFTLLNCAATFKEMQPNLAQSTAVERRLSYANIILVDFIN